MISGQSRECSFANFFAPVIAVASAVIACFCVMQKINRKNKSEACLKRGGTGILDLSYFDNQKMIVFDM
jgi:hypothetical protein